MKKMLLLAAFGTAGMMSATSIEFSNEESAVVALAGSTCVGVESENYHEVVDEMRQNLNEAFCGYGE
jgi:fructose-1-phosphate kinase PfkB-like protein